jgi:hypothetical protein
VADVFFALWWLSPIVTFYFVTREAQCHPVQFSECAELQRDIKSIAVLCTYNEDRMQFVSIPVVVDVSRSHSRG